MIEQFVTLKVPDRSIPFLESPSLQEVESVLENPGDYGDQGEVGGVRLWWDEIIPGADPNHRIIDMSNPPFYVELQFYLGQPGFVMLFYTHTGFGIHERVIGPGTSFTDGTIVVEDTGACDFEVEKHDLLTVPEALPFTKEFLENYGEISSQTGDRLTNRGW